MRSPGRNAPDPAQRSSERVYLRNADPVLARLIDARPDFDPRAWLAEMPPMEPFDVLVFQVVGQQLSVVARQRILGRLRDHFGGKLPAPAELVAADPDDVRRVGMSGRKVATIRTLAEQFVDGRLSDESLETMSDQEVEARLTTIPGIGPWTVQGFLIIALDRQDVVLPGDLALRKIKPLREAPARPVTRTTPEMSPSEPPYVHLLRGTNTNRGTCNDHSALHP
jgi:DNA-3-methyladenine glycosylase II